MRITKIIIKGSSGYCCGDEAYNEKITVSDDTIKYEYTPLTDSADNKKLKWSFKTSSPHFSDMFCSISELMPEILHRQAELVCDIGRIEFIVAYEDKSKESGAFFCPASEFYECFSLIKEFVPQCEDTPRLLENI